MIAEATRHAFPEAHFGPPATAADLARAERELGEPLPAVLRELYLSFDGFSTGAPWLYDLFGSQNGLLAMNREFREGPEYYDLRKFMRSCVFFGDDNLGSFWAIKR